LEKFLRIFGLKISPYPSRVERTNWFLSTMSFRRPSVKL
jgi:hypothetical protein